MNVWIYYGTGFTWTGIVLVIKWVILGGSRTGAYNPGFKENQIRWTLGYYASFTCKMIWSTLEASLIAFYYRSLGAKIAGSASVVGLIGHPADMDLIEIGSDARISFIFIDPISNSTQTNT